MISALRRIRRQMFNWAFAPVVKRYALPVADLLAGQLASMPGNPAYLNFLKHDLYLLKKGYYESLDDRFELTDVVAASLARTSGNPAHPIFSRHGFHLLWKQFDVPIPDEAEIPADFWSRQSELIGLDMNEPQAFELIENVLPKYLNEFRSCFPMEKTGDPRQFCLLNGTYMAVDAHIYYALIRHFKPSRIIEIGAGNSTLLAGVACLENERAGGPVPQLTAIDPDPQRILQGEIPGFTRMIQAKLQDVDLDLFTSLAAGDFLFIDSSHVLRAGNDVQREYLEILPRLAPGVFVHLHDISLPKEYPRSYFDHQLYWNEQYLLQALLAFSNRFQVIWPGNYMMCRYPEKMCAIFPEFNIMRQRYPLSEPTAFWIRSHS